MTASPVPSPSVLDIENLNTSFMLPTGELKVLRDLSFSVARGEILGLVGDLDQASRSPAFQSTVCSARRDASCRVRSA